jgi:hypothetical protein
MVAVVVEIDTIVDDAVQVPHDGTMVVVVVVVEAVEDMMAEEVVEDTVVVEETGEVGFLDEEIMVVDIGVARWGRVSSSFVSSLQFVF